MKKTKSKAKKSNNSKRHKRKRFDIHFPHNSTALVIFVLAIGSLLISWRLDVCNIDFSASIFANVFAGLITGLVICLISGRKQRTIAELESQLKFLGELSAQIRAFRETYNGGVSNSNLSN